ncbi:MAG: transcription antitermination factor NusB [Oscillospiraceae bacterium]|nr:transcription antitermination factor NusB [Oscillospiraceae bacterium]
MTRMTARQLAVQLLFSMEANHLSPEEAAGLFFSEEHYDTLKDEDSIYAEPPDEEQMLYIRRLTDTAYSHLEEIDEVIARYSKGWKLSRLPKTTLAVLRCAICEILFMDDIPDAVAVDEAVEQGKRYDSPEGGAFINGLLGSFLRDR